VAAGDGGLNTDGKEERLVLRLLGSGVCSRTIVFNEAALHRHVKLFLEYYHATRKHLSLEKDTPERRSVQPPESERVVAVHHRYERRAT
jgi:hypothetical protein